MKTEKKSYRFECGFYYTNAIDFICSKLKEKYNFSQVVSEDEDGIITLSGSEPIDVDILFKYGYEGFNIEFCNNDEETVQIARNIGNEIYKFQNLYYEENIKNLIITKQETIFSTKNVNRVTNFYFSNIHLQDGNFGDFNAFYQFIEDLKKYDPKFICGYEDFEFFIEFVKAIEDSFYENYQNVLKMKDNGNFENIEYFPITEQYIVKLLYFAFVDGLNFNKIDSVFKCFEYDVVESLDFQVVYNVFLKHKNKIARNVKLKMIVK